MEDLDAEFEVGSKEVDFTILELNKEKKPADFFGKDAKPEKKSVAGMDVYHADFRYVVALSGKRFATASNEKSIEHVIKRHKGESKPELSTRLKEALGAAPGSYDYLMVRVPSSDRDDGLEYAVVSGDIGSSMSTREVGVFATESDAQKAYDKDKKRHEERLKEATDTQKKVLEKASIKHSGKRIVKEGSVTFDEQKQIREEMKKKFEGMMRRGG